MVTERRISQSSTHNDDTSSQQPTQIPASVPQQSISPEQSSGSTVNTVATTTAIEIPADAARPENVIVVIDLYKFLNRILES